MAKRVVAKAKATKAKAAKPKAAAPKAATPEAATPEARKAKAATPKGTTTPPSTKPAGDSGTPLPRKLGLVAGVTLATIDAPAEYRAWLGDLPPGADVVLGATGRGLRAVHLFVTRRADLEARLRDLRGRLAPAGFVWVSWPKKAAKVETDVTEDVIRDVCLPLGLVDVKVCAVSDVWSGLKLVIRVRER